MKRPLLLDLFCGAGGAAMGYHRAGFEVVGVVNRPQPHYPFRFVQGDALRPPVDLDAFDVIHASPPCQPYTPMTNRRPSHQPALLEQVRVLLGGQHWIIENVVGAPLHWGPPTLFSPDVTGVRLCGTAFGLGAGNKELRRHRLFESNMPIIGTRCLHRLEPLAVYGKPDGRRLWDRQDGHTNRAWASLEEGQQGMGMDWADWHGTREAVPPAYTEWIGRQLMATIR